MIALWFLQSFKYSCVCTDLSFLMSSFTSSYQLSKYLIIYLPFTYEAYIGGWACACSSVCVGVSGCVHACVHARAHAHACTSIGCFSFINNKNVTTKLACPCTFHSFYEKCFYYLHHVIMKTLLFSMSDIMRSSIGNPSCISRLI